MGMEELDGLLGELWRQLRGLGVPVSEKVRPGVRVPCRAKRRRGCGFYSGGE